MQFTSNYFQARENFLNASKNQKLKHAALELENINYTSNQKLYIDIAYHGNKNVKKALFHTSGVHGVEGFPGNAVQVNLMKNIDFSSFPKDIAIIFIHGINPYGMAWLRRWNENNVDINRNILSNFELKKNNCTQIYHELNNFLNPRTNRINWNISFIYNILKANIKYSRYQLKNSIACGQNEYPYGLFFTGIKLEQGPNLILNFLQNTFTHLENIVNIDVHTGLGKFGYDSLFVDSNTLELNQFIAYLGDHTQNFEDRNFIGYNSTGNFSNIFKLAFKDINLFSIIQEFGTYSNLKILKALRKENYYHHYGKVGSLHKSKIQLLKLFSPDNESWRKNLLVRGQIIFNRAYEWLKRL